MATAGSIVVDLLMKTGSFETDTKRAEQRLKQFNKEAVAAGQAIGTAFAGAATALTALVGTSINAMDDMSKAALRASASTEEFSKLAYAANLADVSMQDLQGSLGKLAKAQGDALKTGSEQARIFDALGISVQDATGRLRPATDVLNAFADAFQRQQGSPEIVAAGMKVFGRSFQTLIPLLKDGAEGLKSAGEEAQAFGQVISTEAGLQAEAFNDNLSRMKMFVTGVGNAVAANLLPDLERLSSQFLDSARSGQAVEEAAQGLSYMIRVLGGAMELAMKPIQAIDDLIQGLTIGMVGLVEAGKGVIGLDWDRIKIGWDVANNGADLAYYGRDQVGRDGRGVKPATPKVNFIDPADLLAQDKKAVEQLKQARAEADRLRKLAFGDTPGRATKAGSRAGQKATAAMDPVADYEAIYGAANQMATSLISNMEREIALYGEIGEAARTAYDIAAGAFGPLGEQQAEYLLSLAKTQDALDDFDAIYGKSFDSIVDKSKDATSSMSVFAEQAARNMQDAFADFLFDPFADGLGGMVEGFAKAMQRIAAELAASEAMKAIGKWASGYSGSGEGWINALGSAIGSSSGNRAGGGPVAADNIYRVGEGGRPELFQQGGKSYLIPGDAGTVQPITQGQSVNGMRNAGGSMKIEIINNGAPARVERAERRQGAGGEALLKVFIGAAADDLASGGLLAQAGKGRFGWQEAV